MISDGMKLFRGIREFILKNKPVRTYSAVNEKTCDRFCLHVYNVRSIFLGFFLHTL